MFRGWLDPQEQQEEPTALVHTIHVYGGYFIPAVPCTAVTTTAAVQFQRVLQLRRARSSCGVICDVSTSKEPLQKTTYGSCVKTPWI